MSWPTSILIAFLNAAFGAVGAGIVGSMCVDWYRVPSREGQSGYFIIFFGLLGIVGGLIIGLIATRIVAAGAAPGIAKGLGYTVGSTIGLLVVIAGFAWFAADLPPTISRHGLVVEFEVRCPAGFEIPREAKPGDAWSIYVTADHGDRLQRSGQLRVKDARQVDGRWIIPATVALATSDSGKSIGVSIPQRETQYYNFPLPGKPTKRDMEWSAWLPGPTFGDLAKIPKEDFLALRYRVQFFVPPPPAPPQPAEAEIREKKQADEDAAFAALTPDAPIGEWLRFTKYGATEARVQAVIAAITARPDFVAEFSGEIRSPDHAAADIAMRTLAQMTKPPAELCAAVIDVGRQIVDEVRAINATTGAENSGYGRSATLSVRFAGWSTAAWALHTKSGVNLLPLMIEIGDLAKVNEENVVLKNDVLRVTKFYVDAWSPQPATPAKPPTSP